MRAAGSLLEVDIPELSEVLAFSHQHGTGAADCEDLKRPLGMMAEKRQTESLPDEESWGGGQWFESPKSPSLGVWLFLVQ